MVVIIKTLQYLYEKINKFFSSYITFSALGFLALILAVVAPFYVEDVDLKTTLQSLAQLNITVSIGMAAVSISLKTTTGQSITLIKEILILILLSALGFFSSLLPYLDLQKIFLILNGVVLVQILTSTAKFIKVNIDKPSKNKSNKFKRKN